jgi:hypothetical protein
LKKTRSSQQNAYLWGVVYTTILRHTPDGGVSLEQQGWIDDDLHELFLGEHFGWNVLEGFGRKRLKPKRRSAKLSTSEFADFLMSVQAHMAPMGIIIPDPEGDL